MWLIMACSQAPVGLDVSITATSVQVQGADVVPLREIDAWPLDADLPGLTAALAGVPPQPYTLTARDNDPWYRVRTVYLTATKAGLGPATFVGGGGVSGPTSARPAGAACAAGASATAARPTTRMDLFGDRAEAWVELSARFHPVLDGFAADLPLECWTGPACDLTYPAGSARESCLSGEREGAADRVTLGGASGCAAPIAKAEGDGSWASDLTTTLRGLGLSAGDRLLISPEPLVPFQRFLEATRAVTAAGVAFPTIPESMVQGNDGPPACTAEIRDAEALGLAAARWYGANHLRD